MKWNINDTVMWFKYNLLCAQNDQGHVRVRIAPANDEKSYFNDDSDYTIDNLSDEYDDDDDDEDENDNDRFDEKDDTSIDWNLIESKMKAFGFRAKRNLPMFLQDSYIIKQFGFKNRHHRQLLLTKTKELLEKYPKLAKEKPHSMSAKRYDKQAKKLHNELEGMMEDSHLFR